MEPRAEREESERGIRRVAVIFTHGQGQQTPMKDVAELARSAWSTDPAFGEGEEPVWSVPVYDSDLSEQRRLVTATVKGLQVDFYQFYWADLMSGNRLRDVWRWFYSLLQRRDETPSHLRAVREGVFQIGAIVALFGMAFGLVTAARLATTDALSWANFYAIVLVLCVGWTAYRLARRATRTRAVLGGLGLIAASLLTGLWLVDLVQGQCQISEWLQPDGGLGCVSQSPGPTLARLNEALAVLHSMFAAATLLLILAAGYVLNRAAASFLVPVMADSARLFTPSPENIPNRDRIRKRGMELLEALHNSERRYDRIIMVAHSLGTVVAYNVLAQYWGNVFSLFNHGASGQERHDVEAAAAGLYDGGADAAPVFQFRAAVRRYFRVLNTKRSLLPKDDVNWRTADFVTPGELLRRSIYGDLNAPDPNDRPGAPYRSPWRVSDFITLGSPLSYGSFLLAEDPADFHTMKATRRFPTCPPALEGPPHHAALFAATVWTNVHFERSGLVKGDVVGGPVAPHFGPGVLDVCVTPGPSLPAFAHNEYWRATPNSTGAKDDAHIVVLRAALNLLQADAEADRTLALNLKPGAFASAQAVKPEAC